MKFAVCIAFAVVAFGSFNTPSSAVEKKQAASGKVTPAMWDQCREELGPKRKDAAMSACLQRKKNGG